MPTPDHDQLHADASAEVVRAALEQLRGLGVRVTGPRRAVLEALANQAGHVTADQVAERLAPGVHRATVYRTLDLLVASGVVSHRHLAGGATGYHVTALGVAHEHLHGHCDGCGRVVALPVGAIRDAVGRVLDATGFAVDAHRSTLVGRCTECAQTEGVTRL